MHCNTSCPGGQHACWPHRVLVAVALGDCHEWPKRLLPPHAHLRRDVCDDGRGVELARAFREHAAGEDARAMRSGVLDERVDLLRQARQAHCAAVDSVWACR